jgi:uncharacterized membrane protein YedE/YeeE
MNRAVAAAFACGLLFALGLGLSGMTHPGRILGFLDVFGRWDPTLIFTMAGAIAVHMPLFWLIRRRSAPLYASRFTLPTKTELDARLIGGSALFGVGWALGGFCPGPAVVSVFGGRGDNFVFFVALLAGMALRSLGRLTATTNLSRPEVSR